MPNTSFVTEATLSAAIDKIEALNLAVNNHLNSRFDGHPDVEVVTRPYYDNTGDRVSDLSLKIVVAVNGAKVTVVCPLLK